MRTYWRIPGGALYLYLARHLLTLNTDPVVGTWTGVLLFVIPLAPLQTAFCGYDNQLTGLVLWQRSQAALHPTPPCQAPFSWTATGLFVREEEYVLARYPLRRCGIW